MSNASLIYENLGKFADILGLLGKQEDIFLDFKESRTSNGKLRDDDKAHFSKAASGFAHQEGGVLVWGIEARKGANDVDEAVALKPIPNVEGFLSGLNDFVKYATEPVVDGIQNRVIYENDDQSLDKGYCVTFFPKSDSEHRALGNNKFDFYKRHGDSFSPLSTADIRALFFRNFSPDLELRVARDPSGRLRFSLYNKGRGVARFSSVLLALIPDVGGLWSDGQGNALHTSKIGWMEFNRPAPYHMQFMTNADVVVHPEQEFCILCGPSAVGQQQKAISKVAYRLFAESMVPKEGTLEV